MMQSHHQSEFDVSRIRRRLGGYPTLKHLHGKICPRLRGLPGLADRATYLSGSPHLSGKRDQIKMREYMDRRVTPPKPVTSPTWCPPPPSKQAVSLHLKLSIHKFEREQDLFIRACLHEGRGTQVGEVTRLGGVTRLSI